ARRADDRIRRRTARYERRRAHGRIERICPRLIDQRHCTLAQTLGKEEVIIGLTDDIDDCVAKAKNVVAGIGHKFSRECWTKRGRTQPQYAPSNRKVKASG